MCNSVNTKRQERQNKIQNLQTIGGNQTLTNAEKVKLEIFSGCLEDLEDSINRNSDSSQSLATKVYYLNIILTVATVAGVIIAILKFFRP
ncbi:MAG: hypothetical protein ACOY8P_10450 [Thermodesulfobacteriota bacterium]